MPPRTNGQSSFAVDNASTAEVACPLTNQDGSTCRKRCLGVSIDSSKYECLRYYQANNTFSGIATLPGDGTGM